VCENWTRTSQKVVILGCCRCYKMGTVTPCTARARAIGILRTIFRCSSGEKKALMTSEGVSF
jgi:hypothetical protein